MQVDIVKDAHGVATLRAGLAKFVRVDELTGKNLHECTNGSCGGKKRQAKKKVSNIGCCMQRRKPVPHLPLLAQVCFIDAPDVFVVSVNRQVERTPGRRTKDTSPVTFGAELDLRPFMADTDGRPERYELVAVLVHLGNMLRRGHKRGPLSSREGTIGTSATTGTSRLSQRPQCSLRRRKS